MDPLTALGIAANIWTFVEVGIKVTNQARQLYKSGQETTEEVAAIDVSTQSLDDCVKKLQSSSDCPEQFKDLLRQTQSLSKELLDILTKVKIKDPKSWREYIKVCVRLQLKKSDIALLEKRLGDLRSQVMLNQLSMMRDENSELNKKLDQVQESVKDLSSDRWLEFKQNREAVVRLLRGHYAQSLVKNIRGLEHAARLAETQSRVLSQLRFEVLHRRRDQVWNANYGTFAWMLNQRSQQSEESTLMRQVREAFTTWLESGEGVFHVSGKAGAGKSVLMKLLASHPETRRYLEIWADGSNLCTASFFFYNDGSIEEKSLEGLYRSVLYQILNERPSLMPAIFPSCFQPNQITRNDQLLELTRPHYLRIAFQRFLDLVKEADYKMCLFIDGLDEFEGDATDHREFAEQLRTWTADENAGRVKFCVSSRPHIEFTQTFAPSEGSVGPQIHLHKLTSRDIERYSTTTLQNAKDWDRLTVLKSKCECIVEVIVRRAEGVFLWAYFVVRIILAEARRKGTSQDLLRTLDEIPDEMDQLYEKLLGGIKPANREFTNKVLFTALTNPFPDSLNIICLNWIRDNETWNGSLRNRVYSGSEASEAIERAAYHLFDWTRGILELEYSQLDNSHDGFFNNRVRLFHKTVTDYLSSGKILGGLKQSMTSINMAEFHAGLKIAELRCGRESSFRQRMEILDMVFDERLVPEPEIGWLFYEAAFDLQATNFLFDPTSGQVNICPARPPVKSPALRMTRKTPAKAYFAAFLGITSLPLCMSEAEICSQHKTYRPEAKPRRRNLLLSACLGFIYLGHYTIHRRRFMHEDGIAAIVRMGLSAGDMVTLGNRNWSVKQPREELAEIFTTIWSVMVAALATDLWETTTPSQRSISPCLVQHERILQVVGKLLKLEKQEEVLLIGCFREPVEMGSSLYTHFITLRELVSSLEIDDKATVMKALDAWPDYSDSQPDWVRRWYGDMYLGVVSELTRLRACDIPEQGRCLRFAIVTRTSFLMVKYRGEFTGEERMAYVW
ncbi:hypothetical protein F5Y18DRAFT_374216 [Xylariaceae sp. FL1019]|nr:hypothetical protein F5Y18DRAFT_374216 [Xylariaceae sp. FL1019]